MNKKVLITGMDSIIGSEVFRYLLRHTQDTIVIGRRNKPEKLPENCEYRYLDFNDGSTFQSALQDIDAIFLVIPRRVHDFRKTFSTFLTVSKTAGVKEIIFSSIFRGKYSVFIPHHLVELIIKKSGIDYVIVQPTYFMQNLTTFFKKEIQEDQKIALPHLKRTFNWIDARNAGEAIVRIFQQFDKYKNQTIPLMGNENKNFMEVTAKLTATLPKDVVYTSTIREFIKSLRRKGLDCKEIIFLVVFMVAEMFGNKPTNDPRCEAIIGKSPTRLMEFIMRHLPDLEPTKK